MGKIKKAQVLVPENERPYKVPENWCWVRIGALISLLRGVSYKKGQGHTVKADGDCLILRGGNIHEGNIDIDGDNVYVSAGLVDKSQLLQKNDILIVASTGSRTVIGRAGISDRDYEDVAFGAFLMLVRPAKIVNSRYIGYFFQNGDYRNRIRQLASGTNINNIRTEYIIETPISLAPLLEQQRIVERIDSLFAKLDEAKEKAQDVVDGYEVRKAAILHRAFTGELTEKWRKEHGVELKSWEIKRLDEVTTPRAGYAFDSKKFTDSGYQVVRMGNLYGGLLDLSRNPVFMSISDVNEAMLKRSLINDGDILLTLTGTKYKRDYGYAVCITEPKNLLVNQRILCLTASKNVERDYILYYLQSDIFRDVFFSNETGGVNQGNVSSKFVESIEIKLPQAGEQREIASRLRRLLDEEQQVKEAAEAVLARIDTMKKAILARAFRGELGTNDPAEPWAGELVKGMQ